jgi:leader peptidase (prepilin peptidase)/N-methyltransferase
MVAIAVIDSHSFIIPDRLNLAALALAFANSVFSAAEEATEAVALAALRGCVLSLAFLGLRIVYRNFRKREGLGLGDVKLAGVAGAWLDWQTIAITVEIAAVAALVTYAARQWALSRSLRLTSHLPFGLFFAPAIWLGWFFETTLFTPV